MTRKDYIALAGFMRDLKPVAQGAYLDARWNAMLIYLSDICKRDNPRFDAVRFREACERGDAYNEDQLKWDIANYHKTRANGETESDL